jgi:hypothetical protein
VAHEGARLQECFGLSGLPSVMSRELFGRVSRRARRPQRRAARGEEGLRLAEAVDHPNSLIQAYHGICHVYLCQDEFHQAILWFERGLALCRVWNIPLLLYIVSSALGYAYVLAGRVSDALPLLEPSVSTEAMENMKGRVHGWLSEDYLRLSRVDEAQAFAMRGLKCCRAHAQQSDQAWALRLLGEIFAHRQSPAVELAEASYREALALTLETRDGAIPGPRPGTSAPYT